MVQAGRAGRIAGLAVPVCFDVQVGAVGRVGLAHRLDVHGVDLKPKGCDGRLRAGAPSQGNGGVEHQVVMDVEVGAVEAHEELRPGAVLSAPIVAEDAVVHSDIAAVPLDPRKTRRPMTTR